MVLRLLNRSGRAAIVIVENMGCLNTGTRYCPLKWVKNTKLI